MKAALLVQPKKIEIEDVNIPDIKEKEVLIKVKRAGICGSDNHIFNKGEIASVKAKFPFILGHECSGQIVEIGRDVKNLKIGDRIAIEPFTNCGECEFCKKGQFNLCNHYHFLAAPPDDNGVFVEYLAHDYRHCYLLPENLSYEEGALIEPLAITIQAFERSNLEIGNPILIIGAGTIGLLTLMLVKTLGAGKCVVIDYYDEKLEIAKKLGADFTLNVNDEGLLPKAREISKGKGFPVIFDSVGKENTTMFSVELAKKGGTIVIIGLSDDKSRFVINKVVNKMLTLNGTLDFAFDSFEKAISLVEQNKISVTKIISHYFNFNEINKAFENFNCNNKTTVKTIIKVDE